MRQRSSSHSRTFPSPLPLAKSQPQKAEADETNRSKFYKTSEVVLNDNSGKLSEALLSHRLSQSMYLYPENSTPLTDCIRDRAAHFQGIPSDRLEPLQVVRYATDGFFKHHYDWLSQSQEDGAYSPDVKCNGDSYCEKGMGDRESTFFVYLQADCEGGETEFPEVEMGKDLDSKMWCEFVACEDKDRGVKFRPKAGNAVFWENMEDGKGIGEVLHAGLPVTTGGKIGLNIWTRQRSEVGGGKDVVKFETYGASEDMKVREKADEGHREL
jgi:hypothetical protein